MLAHFLLINSAAVDIGVPVSWGTEAGIDFGSEPSAAFLSVGSACLQLSWVSSTRSPGLPSSHPLQCVTFPSSVSSQHWKCQTFIFPNLKGAGCFLIMTLICISLMTNRQSISLCLCRLTCELLTCVLGQFFYCVVYLFPIDLLEFCG